MIAFGLLNFRRCCALKLEDNSQVGIDPICVSSCTSAVCCDMNVFIIQSSSNYR